MRDKVLLIACGMIKDELNLAMENSGFFYDTIWMDAELHINPDLLRSELQKAINQNQTYEQILLAYGNCGNGLVGLVSEKTKLACLRLEDCIHVLLHNEKNLKNIQGETYFITKAWINSKKSLKEEYHYAMTRYGAKRAEAIMGIMFKHYKSMVLVDTGAYATDSWIYCAKHLSQVLHLDFKTMSGDVGLLEMFLSLKWDRQVAEFEPGRVISKDDFGVECVLGSFSNAGPVFSQQ
ncbi:MAG: hypothetical protein PWP16_359 [Eubacteriaceae bacterium]|jgi:hypothetical protein|nr:hypothetical protein [Eubacteriaceae bacterium]MDK2904578.1 hypothetical protein [Eubacteriaceae bacterium]MDK2935423.1 hypothetical protein [Eubacteriaceae bacterium]MDK2961415.1 hypothetical protein [Eubacteriaceae bacterium]MDN5306996.1 hypothetical protein [Eubacteriaceae bacterium]